MGQIVYILVMVIIFIICDNLYLVAGENVRSLVNTNACIRRLLNSYPCLWFDQLGIRNACDRGCDAGVMQVWYIRRVFIVLSELHSLTHSGSATSHRTITQPIRSSAKYPAHARRTGAHWCGANAGWVCCSNYSRRRCALRWAIIGYCVRRIVWIIGVCRRNRWNMQCSALGKTGVGTAADGFRCVRSHACVFPPQYRSCLRIYYAHADDGYGVRTMPHGMCVDERLLINVEYPEMFG